LVALPKTCWPRVLGPVVIQLYAGECTPSVDRTLGENTCSLQPTVKNHPPRFNLKTAAKGPFSDSWPSKLGK